MPHAGDVLPVSYKLFDANNSVYVKATVKKQDGTQLTGSPANLPNIGLGRYQTIIFTMPSDAEFVTVDYQVFNDSGFTTPSTVYANGTDTFEFEGPVQTTGSSIAQTVIGILDGLPTVSRKAFQCTPSSQIQIIQNTDADVVLRLVQKPSGEPLDLTPYSLAASGDIRANFVNEDLSIRQIKRSGSGGITELSVPTGKVNLHLTAAQTSLLTEGDLQSFEVELIEHLGSSGQTLVVVQFLNALSVAPRIANLNP